MQIMVDTDTETKAGLQSIVALLSAVLVSRGVEVAGLYLPEGYLPPEAPPAESPADAAARAFGGVPAGTSNVLPFPPPPATSTQVASGNGSEPSAPLAPTMTQGTASPATTAPVAPSAGAPGAVKSDAIAAASASPAATADNLPAGIYDSQSLPWDQRIHSETRKKNADGTWRFRRNLDEAVKAGVLAEYRSANPPAPASVPLPPADVPASVSNVPAPPGADVLEMRMAAPVSLPPTAAVPVPPPVTVGVPNPPESSVVPPPHTTVTAPVSDSVPPPPPSAGAMGAAAIPAAPATPPSPAAPAAGGSQMTFRQLMPKINMAMAQGSITFPRVTEVCAAHGLSNITALAEHPDKVPLVAAALGIV